MFSYKERRYKEVEAENFPPNGCDHFGAFLNEIFEIVIWTADSNEFILRLIIKTWQKFLFLDFFDKNS